jgi:hypothetical protein
MARFFHVTSSRNRSSIQKYGLDWKRMGAVGNVAGGSLPEQEGIFVCEDYEGVEYFSRMNGTGGPLDVWAIDGFSPSQLVETAEGYFFLPEAIPPERLKLLQKDINTPGNFG